MEKALEHARKALKSLKARDGISNHTDYPFLYIYYLLGTIYFKISDTNLLCSMNKAIKYYEKFVNVYENSKNAVFPYIHQVYSNLEYMYMTKGKAEESKKCHDKLLGLQEEQKSYDISTLDNMMVTHYFAKEYDKAIECAAMAESLYEANENPLNTIAMARIYNSMGMICENQNDMDSCIKYLHKSVEFNEKLLGECHFHAAPMYHNLSYAYYRNHKYKDAIIWGEKAFRARSGMYFRDHFMMGQISLVIGCAHFELKEYKEAKKYLEEALFLLKRVPNPDEMLLKSIKEIMEKLQKIYNQPNIA